MEMAEISDGRILVFNGPINSDKLPARKVHEADLVLTQTKDNEFSVYKDRFGKYEVGQIIDRKTLRKECTKAYLRSK